MTVEKAARLLLALALLAGAAAAPAAELRPFVSGSMQEIRAAHTGRAFILALWSLECPHCAAELTQLARLRHDHPQLPLVLVSTDSPAEHEAVMAALRRHGLHSVETWLFADAFVERLRYEIDPRWTGELPRAYLFDAAHAVRAHSGPVPEGELQRWLAGSAVPMAH